MAKDPLSIRTGWCSNRETGPDFLILFNSVTDRRGCDPEDSGDCRVLMAIAEHLDDDEVVDIEKTVLIEFSEGRGRFHEPFS